MKDVGKTVILIMIAIMIIIMIMADTNLASLKSQIRNKTMDVGKMLMLMTMTTTDTAARW